jgi:hypothetical protein
VIDEPPNIEMEPTLLTVSAIMSWRSAAHFARYAARIWNWAILLTE